LEKNNDAELNANDVVSFDPDPAWVKASNCHYATKNAAEEKGDVSEV
jgi:hypothetical protein